MVGGLEHFFPFNGNHHPNWLSYFSEVCHNPKAPRVKKINRSIDFFKKSILDWFLIFGRKINIKKSKRDQIFDWFLRKKLDFLIDFRLIFTKIRLIFKLYYLVHKQQYMLNGWKYVHIWKYIHMLLHTLSPMYIYIYICICICIYIYIYIIYTCVYACIYTHNTHWKVNTISYHDLEVT